MRKSNWLVNGACCGLLLWGGFKGSKDWKVFAATHQASLLKNPTDRVIVKGAVASAVPVNEVWTDILSRNPFSFDRNDIDIVAVTPEVVRVTLPKPVLFGIFDLAKGRVAMLGDPGARRSSQNVKVGEQFKGWTVVKIEDRSAVVENNGVEESIVMGTVPIDRDAGKTSVSASPAPVSSAAPSTAPSSVVTSGTAPSAAAPAGNKTIVSPFGNFPQ